jgi:hypothetical protein
MVIIDYERSLLYLVKRVAPGILNVEDFPEVLCGRDSKGCKCQFRNLIPYHRHSVTVSSLV